MKKIALILIFILIPFICDAQQIIITKKKAAGCTEPASGTVIVGTNTTGSTSNELYASYATYFDVNSAAAWDETCTTTTMGTIEVYMNFAASGTCKAFITDSSGNVLTNGISNALVGDFDSVAWHSFTMGTPPTLTKGTNYRFGILCNADTGIGYISYEGGSGSQSLVYANDSYAEPGPLTYAGDVDTSATFSSFRGKK